MSKLNNLFPIILKIRRRVNTRKRGSETAKL